ncbi:conjugal transfer mating pair stabilization protein TraN [Klebsiella pneumoniae]|uniref:conjugal transfer mating pair stabilization protein TraN n=1 Tax=Klebsiella pneumoniae TaxID=573 RepID=UPI002932C1A8|nr:conjugal transfer mating pair stabilization protein TraN [Klebsiella pneumoniae]
MRSHNYFMKAVASLLTVTMSALPIHSYANGSQDQDITAVGKEAQAFGQNLSNSFKSSSGTVQDGTISMPTLKDGQFQMNGGSQINVNDLFPGTSGTNNKPDSYYFPDANKPDVGGLQGIYDSGDDMDSVGNNAKGSLWSDANSANPSISGAAYKVLLDASNRSRPDFSNDPVLNLSKKTYEDMDLIAGGFGDCSAETTINQNTINAHIPEYERCQRVVDQSADCEVVHDYDASVVKHYDGPYNLKSCGEGCTELWIGRVGDNYWSGNCKIYEEYTRVQVSNPDAIVSATLEYAKWDDYMQVWVGKSGQETKVWSGPDGNFPPETAGRCELSTSWERNPNVDVTPYFKNVKDGDVVTFKIRVSVSGEGEGFGRIKLRYDPSKAITKDEWAPQSCMDSAKGVVDGFAEGEITCIDDPTDATGCTVINGIKVCESQLKPSPLPGIPKLCKKVRVKADYDFYKGQMDCWTDPQGETHCPVNTGGNLDSCQKYEENPQCGFISSKCVDGAQGSSGTCYVHEDTYDCGTDVSVPTLEKETEYQCGGPIRCMGDDCLDLTKTQSTDFARATALLNAAQFMTQDMSCTGQDGDDNPTGDENVICSAFAGEAGECKIAVGGVSDCCEKPTNISLADYLNLIMAVPKLDGAVMGLTDGNALKGAYQVLREPALQGWTEVTKPFTSYIENVSGAVDSFFQPVEQFVDQLIDQLKEQVKEVMMDVMKSAGQDAATEQAAAAASEQAAEAMMETATTWLSIAMTIYTVYVVAMVMIQMIYKCEEEEFTMNAKRALKNCTYVGSYCKSKVLGACIEKREAYCCFNSPLSRIIQEQVRPQLGQNFGDPKNPQCEGIPLDKIAEIDWSKINLDEWLGILQQNGKFPDPASINLDSLTGAGNDFNIDGTRKNAQERALERLEGIDIDAKRKEATNSIDPQTGAPTGGG